MFVFCCIYKRNFEKDDKSLCGKKRGKQHGKFTFPVFIGRIKVSVAKRPNRPYPKP